MSSISKLQKLFIIGTGLAGGGAAYYRLTKEKEFKNSFTVQNSWTTNYTPSVKWDSNWDHREPASIVKLSKGTPEDDNRYNTELENSKCKAVRHLYLIRHGQYNLDGLTDRERFLTEKGRIQADLTGQRLAALNIKFDSLVRSTMTRAQETADIILKHMPRDIEIKNCQLLEEGAPVPPEPGSKHWRPEPRQFYQDGARIEAAFRKYFHRAPPTQTEDTHTVIVCHANVIRYFVCRGLQFPAEAWLRISLHHGSITWMSIHPNGNVVLRTLGDTGFMQPEFVTSR